jgi:hypothetical protein
VPELLLQLLPLLGVVAIPCCCTPSATTTLLLPQAAAVPYYVRQRRLHQLSAAGAWGLCLLLRRLHRLEG